MKSRRALLALVAVLAVAITAGVALVAGRSSGAGLPDYFAAPTFSLTDQDGRPFDSAELKGKVWIVDFIYTNCPDVCPLITADLARLGDALPVEHRLGSDIRFVSITVDPARDSAATLRSFARSFGVRSPDQWAFLSGPEAALRRTLAGFHVVAEPAPAGASSAADGRRVTGPGHAAGAAHPGAGLITHSSRLMLVDRRGRVRGLYSGTQASEVDRLGRDLRSLF